MSQGEQESPPTVPITIDQLLALNAEITALCAPGFRSSAGWWSPAETCAASSAASRSPCAAAQPGREPTASARGRRQIDPSALPRRRRGGGTGQLPIALEGLTKYVRGYSEARAAIGLALWYPLLVLALAYVLFVGLLWMAVPEFIKDLEVLGLDVPSPCSTFCRCSVTRYSTGGRLDRH